jgi:hypothetical protein
MFWAHENICHTEDTKNERQIGFIKHIIHVWGAAHVQWEGLEYQTWSGSIYAFKSPHDIPQTLFVNYLFPTTTILKRRMKKRRRQWKSMQTVKITPHII